MNYLETSLIYGLCAEVSESFAPGSMGCSTPGVAEPSLEAFATASALALFLLVDLDSVWAAPLARDMVARGVVQLGVNVARSEGKLYITEKRGVGEC